MNQERMIMGEPPDGEAKSNKGIFIIIGIALLAVVGLVFLLQSGKKEATTVASKPLITHPVEKKTTPLEISEPPSKPEGTAPTIPMVETPVEPKASPEPESTAPTVLKTEAPAAPEIPSEPEITALTAEKVETPVASEDSSEHESTLLSGRETKNSLPDEEQTPHVSKKSQTSEMGDTQKTDEVSQAKVFSPTKLYSWVVKKDDYLWKIAGNPLVYGNSFKWAKIYEANRAKIKDPDLIYPGQIFIIPRD